ncbi:MAG: hypothetical protein AB7N76_27170 [Planctomycetota bacterium]
MTLLELVVAASVLTVVLLALFSSLLQCAALDALSAEQTVVTDRATSVLEGVLAEPWDSQLAHDGETFQVDVETESGSYQLPPAGSLPAGSLAMPGRVEVTDLPVQDLRRIAVIVRWRSRTGADTSLSFSTWASKH